MTGGQYITYKCINFLVSLANKKILFAMIYNIYRNSVLFLVTLELSTTTWEKLTMNNIVTIGCLSILIWKFKGVKNFHWQIKLFMDWKILYSPKIKIVVWEKVICCLKENLILLTTPKILWVCTILKNRKFKIKLSFNKTLSILIIINIKGESLF